MTSTIELRTLGKSPIQISALGLGCWQFSKKANLAGKVWPDIEQSTIQDIVKLSIQGGINWFDTAEVYGNGASEKALAKALQELNIQPGQYTIATKWWPLFKFASNLPQNIEARMDCLKPYPVDLYQVHQPFSFSSEVEEMKQMAKLFKAGKIKAVGVSNFSEKKMRNAWKTLQAEGIPLASNQVQYSLLYRKIESNGIMEAAKELGITIIAWSPLAQGLVTGKFHDQPELIKNLGMRKYNPLFRPKGIERSRPVVELVGKLAEKYGKTPSQIALNWLINFHGSTVVAIPGATKVKHAEENVGALTFTLTTDDLNQLHEVSKSFIQ